MKFNCRFCQEEVHIYSNSQCLTCEVSYRVFSDWYIFFFTQDEYDIGIYINSGTDKTTFWKNDRFVYSLNYTIDINPENASYWFKRLINLKAFS